MFRRLLVSLDNWLWRPRPGDAVGLARLEASRAGVEYVGTELLLLALATMKDRPVGRALVACGLSEERLRKEVSRLLVPPPAGMTVHIPVRRLLLTPRVKRAVERAVEAANKQGLDWSQFQPEHLLLGLLDDAEGVAYQIVANVCKVEALREALAREVEPRTRD
jgi:ATP-dependent Clp protease ATP-binding subunit ClpA